MARLLLAQAPAPSLPRRFLLAMPLWGMFAAALLMTEGDAALQSRWTPATLALVHVFTLGVLGNAMLGSALQFLPVAVGVRLRGGATAARWLHGLFNLGVLALVAGLHARWRVALAAAAILLPLAFAGFAAMTLPGLLAGAAQRLLRAGFGVAIGFALLTALLGGVLAAGLSGWLALPLASLTDMHASFGVLGWVVVLLATVARVVMPMFQGTANVPTWMQATWLCSVSLTLPLASTWHQMGGGASWLAGVVAAHAALFAGAALWLQWRAPRVRRGALTWSWRIGLLLLALAAFVLPGGASSGLVAGVLALAVALPLLVVGMAQEIVAFLGWIELRQRCNHQPVPGVQQLLPERDKRRVLLAHVPQLALLPAAAYWPSTWLARGAGASMLLAWLAVWIALCSVRWRALRYLQRNRTRKGNADVAHA